MCFIQFSGTILAKCYTPYIYEPSLLHFVTLFMVFFLYRKLEKMRKLYEQGLKIVQEQLGLLGKSVFCKIDLPREITLIPTSSSFHRSKGVLNL